MARLFFLTFLSLALASVCAATPLDQQEALQAAPGDKKWSWKDCGTYPNSSCQVFPPHSHAGDPSVPVHITSIEISPDPPKPGENMTVTVIGEATERVEVSRSGSLRHDSNVESRFYA